MRATPTSSCAAHRAAQTASAKSVKIAVFAKGDKAKEAEEAGADVVGAEDIAKRVEEGFDELRRGIATPDLMPVVGRLGRVLGPWASCRIPKVGTVTMDVAKAVEESKAGKVEYRTRPHRHRPPQHRQDELRRARAAGGTTPRLIDEIIKAKPAVAKGRYIRSHHGHVDHGAGREGRPVPHKDILEEAPAATAA